MKSLEQHPRFILLLSRLLISHLSASSSRGLPTIRHLSGIQTALRSRSDNNGAWRLHSFCYSVLRTPPRHVCASRTLVRLKNLLHSALVRSPLVCFLVHQVYARDCRQWQDTLIYSSPKPVCTYRLRVLVFRFSSGCLLLCFSFRWVGYSRDISAACGSTKTVAISWSSNILIS